MTLRFLTAGESHGPAISAILEGLPAGVPLTAAMIDRDLKRRQQGAGRGGRMAIEEDQIQITGGVRLGETIGGPVGLYLPNRDWPNWQDKMQIGPLAEGQAAPEKTTVARPGHIDLAGTLKLGRSDVRDALERASARETAMRVAVGACCKALLGALGMHVTSRVLTYGALDLTPSYQTLLPSRGQVDLEEGQRILDAHAEAIAAAAQSARDQKTTLGGSFQVIGDSIPLGLGHFSQWDRRLDGRLAQALMSIPTVKAVAIGGGSDLAGVTGQESNDSIYPREGSPWWERKTNNMGGIEGGVTNGEPVIVHCHLKPIATQMAPLASVDLATHGAADAHRERSDTAVVEAAAVVGEAMLSFVLADAVLEKFGGDALGDVRGALEGYLGRL